MQAVTLLFLLSLPSQELAQARLLRSFGTAELIEHRDLGRVWLVPADGSARVRKSSIQQAVDDAQEGDTVLLSKGLFVGSGNRDVYVSGKNMTIRSTHGANETVIDCEGKGRAFYFDDPVITSKTVLHGITIVRGSAFQGGGVLCTSNGTPVIDGCLFMSCRAAIGGGLHYGVNGQGLRGTIRDCLFADNNSDSDGGAAWLSNTDVDRCVFMGNACVGRGGGMSVIGLTDSVRNCVFIENVAGSAGGGLYSGTSGTLAGCTFVDNYSDHSGGGILFEGDYRTLMENCILWGNSAKNAGQQILCGGGFLGGFFSPTIRYCQLQGGASSIVTLFPSTPFILDIDESDPLFRDPTNADYRLSAGSPCIDTGNPSSLLLPNEADFELQARLEGRAVDRGYDEHWSRFNLSSVTPGLAGGTNSVFARDIAAAAEVAFFCASNPGTTNLGFGACPSLVLDLSQPCCLGLVPASVEGTAIYTQFVPSFLSGETIWLQAVGLEFMSGALSCSVTNPIMFTYP